MADIASMIYGTAQNVAQNQGQSFPEGIHQGAQLAAQSEALQAKRVELEQQKEKLRVEKTQKLYDYISNARNYSDASTRNNYLKNAIGYRNAMGVGPEVISDQGILGLGSDENQGRIYTLNTMVASGELSPHDALDYATNPLKADEFSKIKPTPAEFIGKSPDLSEAQKQALDRQTKVSIAKDNVAASTGRQMQQTLQLLETARGNPAVAQAEKDIYAADKAKSLANMYGDANKLSQSQVNLLVQEVGKIASGGTPTMHELEGLSPGTLQGALSSKWSKLANDPTPANAASFVKQYTDYVGALKRDAQTVIKDKYGRVLEAKKDTLTKNEYNTLKEQYVQRFDSTTKTIKFNGQDISEEQARAYLQTHPKGQDAAAIKAALGE